MNLSDIPEHQIHELQTFTTQETLSVGSIHKTGTQTVEQIFHHLMLFIGCWIMPLVELQQRT
jgi:hypothetical protein